MKILLIEDDADIAANIGQFFTDRGHQCDYAYNGNHGLNLALTLNFELIILDLMLPGKDGISVCRELRASEKQSIPVLMLTARDTLDDKILGFESGADDYLVKPFSLRELEARVEALARRGRGSITKNLLTVGDLQLNRNTLQVSRDNRSIQLKPREFQILDYLMQHTDRVIPRQELIEHIWPEDQPEGDPLRVHIHNLRQQIDKPFAQELIHTVHGVGYRLA